MINIWLCQYHEKKNIVNFKTVLCFKTMYDRFMGFNEYMYITHFRNLSALLETVPGL